MFFVAQPLKFWVILIDNRSGGDFSGPILTGLVCLTRITLSHKRYSGNVWVQRTVCKYKVHDTVVSLPPSGRKHKLSPAAERKLIRMVKSQPKTTQKQVCTEVEVKHFAFPWTERPLCKKECPCFSVLLALCCGAVLLPVDLLL